MHGLGDEPALQALGIGVTYGETIAVRDVWLSSDPGEMVALVGPNGAGKSSLLLALLGLVPHSGHAVLHGSYCGRQRSDIAFVPQRSAIDLSFPITVEQIVACSLRRFPGFPHHRGRREGRQAVTRALARVGLDGLERRSIGDLSGGQVQRVLLARAIAQKADVLLLDEPLAGVDTPTASALLDLFDALCDHGATILVTTHDLPLVRERFARCVALNCTVVGDGDPSDVLGSAGLERMFAHA